MTVRYVNVQLIIMIMKIIITEVIGSNNWIIILVWYCSYVDDLEFLF